MSRILRPSHLIPCAIIAAVAAMMAYANWQDAKRLRGPRPAGASVRTRGVTATSRDALNARVSDMEARLAKDPADSGAALLLADALLRQTRVRGNPGLALRAEEVLVAVLRSDPARYDVNQMLAALYLSQHRFRDALRIAERNIAARPQDAVNYGALGDAHLELGEYDEAFDAFDRMMALRPSAAAYARVAYARELQGNLDGATEAMKLAVSATSPMDPEGLAWARAQLGELYLQRGELSAAKTEFAGASQVFPGHPFAVVGYAKMLAAQGDLPAALELLGGMAEKSPTPEIAMRTGDLLARLGRHEEAERQYALAEAGWRGDAPDPASLARFLAEHDRKIPEAVTIAEAASKARQDIFTQDALAWAYFKAGRIADAKRVMALATRTGTQDATIRAHAAAIASAPLTVAAK